MRRELGYEEPFHVKYWGLGNEMYGDWQFGACSAEEYAKKALDFAKAMKWMDPSIELIACGYDLGSDWNYEVCQSAETIDQVISQFIIIPLDMIFSKKKIITSACIFLIT